ncbi:MAG: helix-turn-helix transcriptional regulator [Crocinitomicaceae bacterium]|nr:helix-turn-helix transcriptional regulator [Crocinitomicaceae bacterium]
MTQKEFAAIVGVDLSTLRKIEQGKVELIYRTVLKINSPFPGFSF